MELVRVTARAILLPLDALGVQALVLVGEVIAVFAGLASENDFFSWHYRFLYSFSNCVVRAKESVRVAS
jgi:hypothetical protein